MNDPSFLLRFSRTLTVGAAAFLGAAGCAPSFGGAVGAYEHGRYPEAMEELRAVETEAHRWDPSDAARYALYRGLAHFALGDLPASHFWLARVKQGLDIHPALLSADDAGRLASAWAHLPR
ncbi:MAG TPA: hypothetical protein VK540_22265 [Polyangiaceae bacterium]|nr:hypothetical protein [Polyangiaceae bacterium]